MQPDDLNSNLNFLLHTYCKGPKGDTVFIQDTKKIDEETDLEQESGL
jgi:hypothetical protein